MSKLFFIIIYYVLANVYYLVCLMSDVLIILDPCLASTVESQICEPPREMKVGLKNRKVEIRGKITVSD